MESDLNNQGGQSSATVGASGGQGVQQSSIDMSGVVNLLVSDPKFQEALAKQVQSVKDRRFAEQERQISGFQQQLERLQQLESSGLSRPAALQFMDMQERLGQYEQSATRTPPGQQVAAPTAPRPSDTERVDVDAFLKAVGVDPSDPEVTELYRSGNATPAAFVSLVTKKKTATVASPAQVMPAGSGASVPQETLMDQYNREKANLTPAQRIELRDKYRKAGLDI